MKIVVVPETSRDRLPGKLADVELHFEPLDGALNGLKLIGFAVWERRTGGGRNVTFPARSYSVNGERRSFSLVRPLPIVGQDVDDASARLRLAILEAYEAHEAHAADIATQCGRCGEMGHITSLCPQAVR
jgi:hypothetical protein